MNAKINGVELVSQPADSTGQTENIHLGPAVIHRPSGLVETPAGAQQLRTKELALVEHLFQNASITFSREELLLRVWHCQPGLLTRTVDQTVATLRKKIEPHPEAPQFLQTVFGVGYRLVV